MLNAGRSPLPAAELTAGLSRKWSPAYARLLSALGSLGLPETDEALGEYLLSQPPTLVRRLERDLDALERELAKDPAFPFIFFRRYLGHWHDCEPGPHHVDMVETLLEMLHMERPSRYPAADAAVAYGVPRGHGKTTVMMSAALFVLLNWERFPLFQQTKKPAFLYAFSNTQRQAEKDLRMVRRQFETNALLRRDFGIQVGEIWRNDEIHLRNGAKMCAAGVGASVRGAVDDGGRPNVLFFDDIDDEDNILTPEQRVKVEDWADKSAIPLSIAGESVVFGWGTILHVDSWLAKVTNRELRPSWGGRVYSAVEGGDTPFQPGVRALWRAKHPVSKLRKAYRRGTPKSWATEFQNKPVSDETSLFPMTWLNAALEAGRSFSMLDEPPPEDLFDLVVQGVDLAFVSDPKKAEAQKSAFNVCWSLGVDRHANVHIFAGDRRRGLAPTQIDDWLMLQALSIEPDMQVVEDNNAGHVHIDRVRRETGIPIVAHHTGRNKRHNVDGVPGLQRPFEDGKVIIWCGDPKSRELAMILVHELHTYPGAHTDCVMAFWVGWFRIRKILGAMARRRHLTKDQRREWIRQRLAALKDKTRRAA